MPILWAIAPALVILSATATLAIIPFGDVVDGEVGLYGIDVSIGILYAFAFGSISFYGLLLGGWASGSKYSFMGAMRSAAQLISYEISMGLALLGVIMMAGSLSLVDIANAQADTVWYIVPQFVGFLIFMVAGFAETNRPPFDLPEADAELVSGYNTEYGGMRFGSYFMAEYMEMIVVSGIAAAMFLGGWHLPFGIETGAVVGALVMLAKIIILICVFIWVRATLPRLRYDQLMSPRLEGPAAAGDAERARHRGASRRHLTPRDPRAAAGARAGRRAASPRARSGCGPARRRRRRRDGW